MSPYTLLQEELNKDPWKIFVCCIFCNLTKRRTSEPYFWKFLNKWPTPESAATLNEKELKSLIQPLGLVDRRSKALKKMSIDYLEKDWHSDATKLYGVGKYGSDAYRIFVKDEWREVTPTDSALKNYVKWKKENEHLYT
jgi:methyl-CpG-binding domain protein 4